MIERLAQQLSILLRNRRAFPTLMTTLMVTNLYLLGNVPVLSTVMLLYLLLSTEPQPLGYATRLLLKPGQFPPKHTRYRLISLAAAAT